MVWVKCGITGCNSQVRLQWALWKQQLVSDSVKRGQIVLEWSLWFLYKSDGGGEETTQQAGRAAEPSEEPHPLLLLLRPTPREPAPRGSNCCTGP